MVLLTKYGPYRYTTGVATLNQQASQQLVARRREVASLTHKGWTQAAIARHLKIPPGTVSCDLAAMHKFWRDFPVHDFENVRLEQLQKIDVIEAEAWAAWERSQQRRQIVQLTRGKTVVKPASRPAPVCRISTAIRGRRMCRTVQLMRS